MSPYGVDKELGGDSKHNDKFIEGCVDSVMKKSGKDKSTAIAICKAQLRKNKAKASVDMTMDPEDNMDTVQEEQLFMQECIAKLSSQGISNKEAEQYCKLSYQLHEGDTVASKNYILKMYI